MKKGLIKISVLILVFNIVLLGGNTSVFAQSVSGLTMEINASGQSTFSMQGQPNLNQMGASITNNSDYTLDASFPQPNGIYSASGEHLAAIALAYYYPEHFENWIGGSMYAAIENVSKARLPMDMRLAKGSNCKYVKRPVFQITNISQGFKPKSFTLLNSQGQVTETRQYVGSPYVFFSTEVPMGEYLMQIEMNFAGNLTMFYYPIVIGDVVHWDVDAMDVSPIQNQGTQSVDFDCSGLKLESKEILLFEEEGTVQLDLSIDATIDPGESYKLYLTDRLDNLNQRAGISITNNNNGMLTVSLLGSGNPSEVQVPLNSYSLPVKVRSFAGRLYIYVRHDYLGSLLMPNEGAGLHVHQFGACVKTRNIRSTFCEKGSISLVEGSMQNNYPSNCNDGLVSFILNTDYPNTDLQIIDNPSALNASITALTPTQYEVVIPDLAYEDEYFTLLFRDDYDRFFPVKINYAPPAQPSECNITVSDIQYNIPSSCEPGTMTVTLANIDPELNYTASIISPTNFSVSAIEGGSFDINTGQNWNYQLQSSVQVFIESSDGLSSLITVDVIPDVVDQCVNVVELGIQNPSTAPCTYGTAEFMIQTPPEGLTINLVCPAIANADCTANMEYTMNTNGGISVLVNDLLAPGVYQLIFTDSQGESYAPYSFNVNTPINISSCFNSHTINYYDCISSEPGEIHFESNYFEDINIDYAYPGCYDFGLGIPYYMLAKPIWMTNDGTNLPINEEDYISTEYGDEEWMEFDQDNYPEVGIYTKNKFSGYNQLIVSLELFRPSFSEGQMMFGLSTINQTTINDLTDGGHTYFRFLPNTNFVDAFDIEIVLPDGQVHQPVELQGLEQKNLLYFELIREISNGVWSYHYDVWDSPLKSDLLYSYAFEYDMSYGTSYFYELRAFFTVDSYDFLVSFKAGVSSCFEQLPVPYAMLKRTLDQGYHKAYSCQDEEDYTNSFCDFPEVLTPCANGIPPGKWLMFRYDEDYTLESGAGLNYAIYDYKYEEVLDTGTITAEELVAYGDNRFVLDVSEIIVGESQYFILEVINEKNEKRWLRVFIPGV